MKQSKKIWKNSMKRKGLMVSIRDRLKKAQIIALISGCSVDEAMPKNPKWRDHKENRGGQKQ